MLSTDGITDHLFSVSKTSEITTTTTQYLDATPIATPVVLAALPTGGFQATFENAYSSSDSCLIETNQQDAWSCSFPDDQNVLDIDVTWEDGSPLISLTNSGTLSSIDFGTQLPTLVNQPLVLVQDLYNTSLGAAYHFQTYYDKLVVLPEDKLQSSAKNKRTAHGSGPPPLPQDGPDAVPTSSTSWGSRGTRQRVTTGEQPWFCWFNNTFVEGFVYVDQAALPSSQNSSAVSTSSPMSSGTISLTSLTAMSTTTSSLVEAVTSTAASMTTSFYISASPSISTSLATTTFSSGPASSTVSAMTADFPRLIKIEEQRVSGSSAQPTCTKMSKGQNGCFTVVSAAGSPIQMPLAENDPSVSYIDTRRRRAVTTPRGCYCQWSS